MKDDDPAYVDWETYERIQATLRDNRAGYLHKKIRCIPRYCVALGGPRPQGSRRMPDDQKLDFSGARFLIAAHL